MNKILRYSFVALLAMIGLNISAQEVTLDFTITDPADETGKTSIWGFPSGSSNKLVEENSYTYDGWTVKVAGSTGEGYYWHNKDHYLLFGKQGAYLTLPAFNFDVERIDIEGNSTASAGTKQNIFVGDEAVSTETTGAQGTNYFTIAEGYQAAGTIYTIKVTSKHNNQIKTIKIWKKGAGTKQAAEISWSSSSATVTIGADDNIFPTLNNPNGLSVSYTSSKEEVATIDASGAVTLVAAGSTKISAVFEGNDSYEASTVSYNLTVKDAEGGDGRRLGYALEPVLHPVETPADSAQALPESVHLLGHIPERLLDAPGVVTHVALEVALHRVHLLELVVDRLDLPSEIRPPRGVGCGAELLLESRHPVDK